MRTWLRTPSAWWVQLALGLLPLLWLVWRTFTDQLGANPAETLIRTTGDIIVKLDKTSGVNTMEIFQEDAYTAGAAPTGYTKYSNIVKNGSGKGAVAVTVTNAAKNYVVLLTLDGYSEVSYTGR